MRFSNWWNRFYKENKLIVWAAALAVIISLGVLLKVKDEVTRFTLIMPVFAGFILFSILVTADEELDDEENGIHDKEPAKKRIVRKLRKK
ncbi:hypothetical protein A2Y99_02160 [Candidatus Gottesmanbacteria bacterium RBG_13_37_7]|uniref:Uncharacterized protein n=1 Tax=Candidatus Gottesmanbacteria bacterium RBG_13_37_7 TaxID=1798369 RepID=A0A1F5YIL4_9BACT|nr:MAG: hypothetical protein A2Y99_02160 [Candidatus Gottesmanbacteria bacterium RBG_13_37_7]